jgi:hypothetical protein
MFRFSFESTVMKVLFTAAVFIFATTNGLQNGTTEELGRMSHMIALKHFTTAKCLAVVTEGNRSIVECMQALVIRTFHIQLPRTAMESKRVTAGLYERVLSLRYIQKVS